MALAFSSLVPTSTSLSTHPFVPMTDVVKTENDTNVKPYDARSNALLCLCTVLCRIRAEVSPLELLLSYMQLSPDYLRETNTLINTGRHQHTLRHILSQGRCAVNMFDYLSKAIGEVREAIHRHDAIVLSRLKQFVDDPSEALHPTCREYLKHHLRDEINLVQFSLRIDEHGADECKRMMSLWLKTNQPSARYAWMLVADILHRAVVRSAGFEQAFHNAVRSLEHEHPDNRKCADLPLDLVPTLNDDDAYDQECLIVQKLGITKQPLFKDEQSSPYCNHIPLRRRRQVQDKPSGQSPSPTRRYGHHGQDRRSTPRRRQKDAAARKRQVEMDRLKSQRRKLMDYVEEQGGLASSCSLKLMELCSDYHLTGKCPANPKGKSCSTSANGKKYWHLCPRCKKRHTLKSCNKWKSKNAEK